MANDETGDTKMQEFCDVAEEMTRSMAAVRELVHNLRQKREETDAFSFQDGISLLSIKHQLLLSYMQSLVLLHSHRVLGHTLAARSPPSEPFNSTKRSRRGTDAGDLVDSMIEDRIVLEKIKILESKMRYQIEKLVRLAAEEPSDEKAVNGWDLSPAEARADAVHRTDEQGGACASRAAGAACARVLAHLDPSRPFVDTATGLGTAPALQSKRARELQRMEEFEEENMTRLVLKKRDERRRRKDEEDIALGGVGGIVGKRRGGGFEDEFADVLREGRRARGGAVGDGYEELRARGRKEGALARSRVRARDEVEEVGEGPRQRKKGRFERDVRVAKKRSARKVRQK
ncbi:hypothetical protein BC834DRAFT_897811 [Gloeopeniophorella convolvens]|nr:hypothetical protein BC834DRAFT_897811 [Gloeopeniophorella convolvens]